MWRNHSLRLQSGRVLISVMSTCARHLVKSYGACRFNSFEMPSGCHHAFLELWPVFQKAVWYPQTLKINTKLLTNRGCIQITMSTIGTEYVTLYRCPYFHQHPLLHVAMSTSLQHFSNFWAYSAKRNWDNDEQEMFTCIVVRLKTTSELQREVQDN